MKLITLKRLFLKLSTMVFLLVVAASTAIAAARVDPKLRFDADAPSLQRVVVTLRPITKSSQNPDLSKAHQQRIAQSVDAVLRSLPKATPEPVRRFDHLPAFVVQANVATLRALARHPDIANIDLDIGGEGSAMVAPDEASVLNGVGNLSSFNLTGRGMKVAVLDTGVQGDHPDLKSSVSDEQCFCSSNPDGVPGCCPNGQRTQSGPGSADDENGHGSNVTGIIVGDGNIAPRGALPEAKLVSVRVMDAFNQFCCLSDVISGLDWLASHHPDVDAVNMSLGTFTLYPSTCDDNNGVNRMMADAIQNLRSLGAIVTVSSGNQAGNNGVALPACIAAATAVGATWDSNVGAQTVLGCTDSSTAAKQVTCFSNLGGPLDVLAAGAYVRSTSNRGGSSTYAGTSQAAPMVAACATALKQRNASLTPSQIDQILRNTGEPVTASRNGASYPFINCEAALNSVQASFAIGPGMTGTWYDSTQSGHGLFIEILDNNVLVFSWFTFSPAGDQAWIIGAGDIVGNRAVINAVRPVGGRFIPNFDPTQVNNEPWGQVTIEFDDCNNGRIDYNSSSFGTGTMRLQRLTQIAGNDCAQP